MDATSPNIGLDASTTTLDQIAHDEGLPTLHVGPNSQQSPQPMPNKRFKVETDKGAVRIAHYRIEKTTNAFNEPCYVAKDTRSNEVKTCKVLKFATFELLQQIADRLSEAKTRHTDYLEVSQITERIVPSTSEFIRIRKRKGIAESGNKDANSQDQILWISTGSFGELQIKVRDEKGYTLTKHFPYITRLFKWLSFAINMASF
jgi:hypothetical protein